MDLSPYSFSHKFLYLSIIPLLVLKILKLHYIVFKNFTITINDILISESEVFFLKNKKYALKLVKAKINGLRIVTYEQIAEITKLYVVNKKNV